MGQFRILVPKSGTDVDFRGQVSKCVNLRNMRVLCLSREKDLCAQVGKIFSDKISVLTCMSSQETFLESATTEAWDIFVVDFDCLTGGKPNPVEFFHSLRPPHAPLFMGSNGFSKWHDDLRRLGAVVLHKPISIGEVGLALRKLIADAAQKKSA
jgi:hypothetical protein